MIQNALLSFNRCHYSPADNLELVSNFCLAPLRAGLGQNFIFTKDETFMPSPQSRLIVRIFMTLIALTLLAPLTLVGMVTVKFSVTHEQTLARKNRILEKLFTLFRDTDLRYLMQNMQTQNLTTEFGKSLTPNAKQLILLVHKHSIFVKHLLNEGILHSEQREFLEAAFNWNFYKYTTSKDIELCRQIDDFWVAAGTWSIESHEDEIAEIAKTYYPNGQLDLDTRNAAIISDITRQMHVYKPFGGRFNPLLLEGDEKIAGLKMQLMCQGLSGERADQVLCAVHQSSTTIWWRFFQPRFQGSSQFIVQNRNGSHLTLSFEKGDNGLELHVWTPFYLRTLTDSDQDFDQTFSTHQIEAFSKIHCATGQVVSEMTMTRLEELIAPLNLAGQFED